jgi:hypothetical protein
MLYCVALLSSTVLLYFTVLLYPVVVLLSTIAMCYAVGGDSTYSRLAVRRDPPRGVAVLEENQNIPLKALELTCV